MEPENNNNSQSSKGTFVCPWWIVRIFDNFLRPLFHNPRRMFQPYIKAGMTVLDIGCGRGFASLGLARLVGEDGLVISADLQPEMLKMVQERAKKAGLSDRIRIHQCESNRIGVNEEIDFAVAFFMVHEVPDTQSFLKEIFGLLKPGAHLFIAEPKFHVNKRDFENTIYKAQTIGFKVSERPSIRLGRAVLLLRDTAG